MKANAPFRNQDDAQVGIGTMIVFIATILVAAVAAGVLIDTSQKLQAKSTATGNAATEQVGTSVEMQAVYGFRDATTPTTIESLNIWIEPTAGSEPVDLKQLIIRYGTSSGTTNYAYDDNSLAAPTDVEFIVYDDDGTTALNDGTGDFVLEAGERAMIMIGTDGTNGVDLALAAGASVSLDLIPESGIPTGTSFDTPNSYNDDIVFQLA